MISVPEARHGARGCADLLGHGRGGVRIDDENAHRRPALYTIPLPASEPWRRCRAWSTRMTISAGEDHQKGYRARQRSQRIDIRLGDGCRQPLQFERQGVDRTDRLARTREFVPGQGEAEQTDADDRRQDDRQHDIAEGLPRRRAEIARGLFEPAVEPVEDRKHDQEAEGQGPGQMRAKTRGEQSHPVVQFRPRAEPESVPCLIMKSSSSRNSSAMPSEVMIDGMIRLAMAT